ncbi:ribonuclease P protein component [bacterium]|nr:MAG: ribonuclease P protein component [bacterium]
MKEEQNNLVALSNSARLPKSGILRGKTKFEQLFSKGTTVHGAVSSIRYILIKEEAPQQLMAFVVKKKLGKAVLRNRFKRFMREAYRNHQAQLSPLLLNGFSIHGAFMAQSSSATSHDIFKDCELLLTKICKKHLSERA